MDNPIGDIFLTTVRDIQAQEADVDYLSDKLPDFAGLAHHILIALKDLDESIAGLIKTSTVIQYGDDEITLGIDVVREYAMRSVAKMPTVGGITKQLRAFIAAGLAISKD